MSSPISEDFLGLALSEGPKIGEDLRWPGDSQGAAKGGRQKEFDHFFSFSGLCLSLVGHFF